MQPTQELRDSFKLKKYLYLTRVFQELVKEGDNTELKKVSDIPITNLGHLFTPRQYCSETRNSYFYLIIMCLIAEQLPCQRLHCCLQILKVLHQFSDIEYETLCRPHHLLPVLGFGV